MNITVHVACDHELFRRSLAAFLDEQQGLNVKRTSPEGMQGVRDTAASDPDVLLLAVPIQEDVTEHVRSYQRSLPNVGIVGFCFTEAQAEGYRQAGIAEIIRSNDSASDLCQALRRASQ